MGVRKQVGVRVYDHGMEQLYDSATITKTDD